MSVTLLQALCACEGTGSLQWSPAQYPSQQDGSLGKEWELAAVNPDSSKECEVCRWLDLETHTQDLEMLIPWDKSSVLLLQLHCKGAEH